MTCTQWSRSSLNGEAREISGQWRLAFTLLGAENRIAQSRWRCSLLVTPFSAVIPLNYLSLDWTTILRSVISGHPAILELLLCWGVLVALSPASLAGEDAATQARLNVPLEMLNQVRIRESR